MSNSLALTAADIEALTKLEKRLDDERIRRVLGMAKNASNSFLIPLSESALRMPEDLEPESNDPKGDAGKLKCPLHLIPPYPMEETAHVHAHGADKYGPYNWRETKVEANTYIAAILRHLNAWRDGENNDPESGFSHLAHIAANCNILLDAQRHGTLDDNRFRTHHESLQPEFAHLPKA